MGRRNTASHNATFAGYLVHVDRGGAKNPHDHCRKKAAGRKALAAPGGVHSNPWVKDPGGQQSKDYPKMTKRDIFAELMEGFDALEEERDRKVTLRKSEIERSPSPEMTPETVRQIRRKLRVSQSVFALMLRTEPRTIENWEQGKSKPNAQAAILLTLVDRHPELLDEIAAL